MKRSRDIAITIGTQSVYRRGAARYDVRDPYHMAVTLPWVPFTIAAGAVFFAVNALFALLFVTHPGSIAHARDGSFFDAFYFCVETMATVGYGGMAPGSPYGHFVASLLSVMSIAFTAVATGIIFVRFSRPRSRMSFAEHAVIAMHEGKPTLMVRLAYSRASIVVNALASIDVLMLTHTKEGARYRLMYALPLLRHRMPALILAWTIMHVIDENSPLHGMDAAAFEAREARVMVTIEGRDRDLGVDVLDVHSYEHPRVLHGRAYADIVSFDENRAAYADLTRLSEIADAGDRG